MKKSTFEIPVVLALFLIPSTLLHADERATIGHSDLLAREPGLDGSGLRVAQVEASVSSGDVYQANPAAASQNAVKFSYFDSSYSYPNAGSYVSTKQSGHANTVANHFYDTNTGVATDVSEIYMFTAGSFFNDIVYYDQDIGAKVINQSYVYGASSVAALIDAYFDNYAANHKTLLVNGLNNGTNTQITPPASSYNGIAVGREDLNHSQGPTDNRSKPELIAPGAATSYAAPYVSGCATILMEAAMSPLEHGGAGTSATASDYRTIKALLLNGAVKDFSWSNSQTRPFDTRRGAGLVNVNNAHLQLQGGKHSPTVSESVVGSSSPIPASSQVGNVSSLIGWNFSTITNLPTSSQADNYYFDLPAGTSALYDVTATLVWERQANQSDVNNLDLVLYNVTTGQVVEQSISTVDNVEHIYLRDLAAGRYALQVFKKASGNVTTSQEYALAFNYSVPAPDAPSSLAASPGAYSEIDLSWTDNATDEVNFELQRSVLSGRAYSTIATLPANTTSYSDVGLAENVTYYYRVKATNANGDSFYTNVASATTLNRLLSWRQSNFGNSTDSGDAANSADPDHDGLDNLTEYALGTDPTSAAGSDGAMAQPKASIVSVGGTDYLQITVNRVENKTDLNYIVKVCDELGTNWTEVTNILENSATTLRVRDNVAATGNDRRFIRLSVEEK